MTIGKDLIGKRFGSLVVLSRGPNASHSSRTWFTHCDCGKEQFMRGENLMSGNSTNCGCARKYHKTHGQSKSLEYELLHKAKIRAKKGHLPFDLKLEDIQIPEFCPVLPYIKLNRNNTKLSFDSPTVDRLVPELGYVKGNIHVISWRANDVKGNATSEELIAVAEWMRGTHGKTARIKCSVGRWT
jgi:hypothetical protein